MEEKRSINGEVLVAHQTANSNGDQTNEDQTNEGVQADSNIHNTAETPAVPETENAADNKSDVITVMVTGKPKNGKTTALNNIFDLQMETKASAMVVTQGVRTTLIHRGTTTMQVIDTPGLGSADAPKERITVQMAESTMNKDYTLIYCLSINPNSMLTEVDQTIVYNLTEILGKNVWKKCILLLTFADSACNEFDSVNDYIEFVKEHAKEFQALLKGCGIKKCQVKTIFDYKKNDKLELQEKIADIVAIPIMKLKKSDDFNILPHMLAEGQDWTDLVFIELLKKAPTHQRKSFFEFKYDKKLPDNYAIRGALIGAIVGHVAGTVGGPLLSLLGGGVGASLGLVVGGATQLGVSLKNRMKTDEMAPLPEELHKKESDKSLDRKESDKKSLDENMEPDKKFLGEKGEPEKEFLDPLAIPTKQVTSKNGE